jgi:hypothetical protein
MPNGQIKDISCRDMLRALDKDGKITLPPVRKKPSHIKGQAGKSIQMTLHDTSAVDSPLKTLMPLNVVAVEEKWRLGEFKSMIDMYHYLGFGRTVGENMKYMVYSNEGALLCCLLFGSAAWSSGDRDEHIGWSREKRRENLQLMTDNTRFLILPWVKVPHLASHVLSQITRRLSVDWEAKYGHPIYCLETFVERDRFKGTCYKAANWIYVGKTKGRGRDDIDKSAKLPIKDIYLYPLDRRYRTLLGG